MKGGILKSGCMQRWKSCIRNFTGSQCSSSSDGVTCMFSLRFPYDKSSRQFWTFLSCSLIGR